nr:hypothetical protein [Bifidobacterium indicum]
MMRKYEDAGIFRTTDARPGFQLCCRRSPRSGPHTLIMWKTDRLGRDKYVLAMDKKTVREADSEIRLPRRASRRVVRRACSSRALWTPW